MRVRRWVWAAMAGAAALGGCTLAEVVVPESEDRLVVEAVLRTDRERQAVLLHRSVRDGAGREEPGATVVVRGPEGMEYRFDEAPGEACFAVDSAYLGAEDAVEVRGSCYLSSEDAGYWVVPGATYVLEVATLRGEEAGGRTTVPGAFALRGLAFSAREEEEVPVCALPADGSFTVRWSASAGAWAYVAPLRISGLAALLPGVEVADPLELVGLSVSSADTSILLPQQFGVFDRFSLDREVALLLQRGLPGGTVSRMTVAAADRNYVNGVRGGTFNPSGPLRISSIAGDGVGVFGSLVPLSAGVEAGSPGAGRPPCAG